MKTVLLKKKSDYKLHWDTFLIGEERFECGIDVGYRLNKNKNNEYDAQELYLLFTNHI